MKARIIKGPMFEQAREKAYELLYQIIARKVAEQMKAAKDKPDKT